MIHASALALRRSGDIVYGKDRAHVIARADGPHGTRAESCADVVLGINVSVTKTIGRELVRPAPSAPSVRERPPINIRFSVQIPVL
jgi:hypothetical protein